MQDYKWAGNKQKLARVIGGNPHGTEAEHLEAYRKTLGVVFEEHVPKAKEEVVLAKYKDGEVVMGNFEPVEPKSKKSKKK